MRFGVVLLDIFIETHEVYAAITVVDVKQCLRQRSVNLHNFPFTCNAYIANYINKLIYCALRLTSD